MVGHVLNLSGSSRLAHCLRGLNGTILVCVLFCNLLLPINTGFHFAIWTITNGR